MFCPKCGNEIKGNAKFCGKCGAVLSGAAPETPLYNPVQGMSMTEQKAASGSAQSNGAQASKKAEAGIAAQKVIDGAGKAAGRAGSKLQQIIADYLDTWRQLKKLGEKEKYLWFGIHGGVALLLLCVIILPVFLNVISGDLGGMASRGRVKVEKVFQEALSDSEVSEEDITNLAQAIHDYEDWQKFEQCYRDGMDEYREVDGYANLIGGRLGMLSAVWEELNSPSGLGSLLERYHEWYDKDGLMEKILGRSEQVEYVSLYTPVDTYLGGEVSRFPGEMFLIRGVEDETDFRRDGRDLVEVEWFVGADSNEITFIKTTRIDYYADPSSYGRSGSYERKNDKKEVYVGKFEISGTELLVTLDGKQYRLTEASTDIEKRQAETFDTMARGTYVYSQEFYNMIASNLGSWESFKVRDEKPLYIQFVRNNGGRHLTVLGTDGVWLEQVKDCKYEQGEGKTVTISSKSGSVEASYDKVGDNLVITVNGTDYTLSSTTILYTGTYNDFGEKVK